MDEHDRDPLEVAALLPVEFLRRVHGERDRGVALDGRVEGWVRHGALNTPVYSKVPGTARAARSTSSSDPM